MKPATFFILILGHCLTFSLQAQTFTLITRGDIASDTTNTNGASWIDVDADGDLDLFLTNANVPFGQNTLYRNDGKDTFTRWEAGEVTGMQTPSFGHAWGDYDNDGLPDLLVVNAFTKIGSLLYQNLGEGKFRRNEGFDIGNNSIKGFNAAWADYDQDGFLDVVITHPAKFVGKPVTSNFLFHNEGNGFFSEITYTPVTQPIAPFTNGSWIDFDRDGDQDLFIGSGPANGTLAPDFIYKNTLKENGKPGFQRITQPIFARDSLDGQVWNWIDLENDGDLDAYVTNWGGASGGMPNHLYLAQGDTMVRVTEGNIVTDRGISLANVWADFDNDGFLDCLVGNGSNQPNRLYMNLGDGTFRVVEKGHLVEETKNTWGICAGDYDNDGDMDVFVSNKTTYMQGGDVNFLYRNDTQNGNHWFTVHCIGTKSHKQGIGAKVYLTTTINGKKMTQYREIGSNNTFLGQNDLRAHFGLGKATTVEKLEIRWPSGEVSMLENLKADQIYRVEE